MKYLASVFILFFSPSIFAKSIVCGDVAAGAIVQFKSKETGILRFVEQGEKINEWKAGIKKRSEGVGGGPNHEHKALMTVYDVIWNGGEDVLSISTYDHKTAVGVRLDYAEETKGRFPENRPYWQTGTFDCKFKND